MTPEYPDTLVVRDLIQHKASKKYSANTTPWWITDVYRDCDTGRIDLVIAITFDPWPRLGEKKLRRATLRDEWVKTGHRSVG